MKRIFLLILLLFTAGCGYGMQYTKTVPAIPQDVMSLKVNEIKDFAIGGRRDITGKGDFIRNLLLNELAESGRVRIEESAPYQLTVKVEDYRPGYRKYIALSGQIINSSTNQAIWNASISGMSKKLIDEVTQNVIKELVKGMVGKEK